jgi:hypothetical protein
MKRQIINIYKFRIGPLLIVLLLNASCGNDENIVVFTEPEVVRMLSNDSSKSWIRKMITVDGQTPEISECELLIQTKYFSSNTEQVYIIESIDDFCGGITEQLDSGSWEALEESGLSDRIDRIAYYSGQGGTTIKNIKEITSLYLTTEEENDGTIIQETFESSQPN